MGTKRLGALVFFLVILVFARLVYFEFINFDDNIHIYENPLILAGDFSLIVEYWKNPVNQLFVPVTYSFWHTLGFLSRVCFGVPALPGGLSPLFFHAFSVFLHGLNALLVFLLVFRLTKHRLGSFLGALLFAFHPMQVESVAWISAQKDLLAVTFSLGALLLLTSNYLFLSLLFFALALLSKPSVLPLPCVALLLCRLLEQKLPWKTLSLWSVFAIASAVVTKGLQPDFQLSLTVPWSLRPLVVADTLLYYLSKLVIPYGLTVDPGRRPQVALTEPTVYFAWGLWLSLSLILWERRHERTLMVPILAFLFSLFPICGLIPFAFQNHSTVADRYLYFPMIFLALGFSLAIRRWGKATLAGLAIAVLLTVTFFQISHWRNSVFLYTHTLAHNPHSPVAYNNLASLAIKQGLYEEGIELYQQALKCNPPNDEPRKNLVKVYLAMGRVDEAAVTLGPTTLGQQVGPHVYEELLALAKEWDFPRVAETIAQDLTDRQHRSL